MRVLVCGGRDYSDGPTLRAALERVEVDHLIEGGAQGADALAREWARSRRITTTTFSADWRKHGKAAGPIRNTKMLAEGKPEIVIAFPGGRGTADMVRQARAAGVTVVEIAQPSSDSAEG